MLSKAIPDECTFSPQVNSRAVEGRVEGECFERLHKHAHLQQMKKELQAEEGEAGCTFSPTITKKAQKLTEEAERARVEKGLSVGEALYLKGQEKQKAREESRRKLAMEGLTFKPKINARSAEKQSEKPFGERLYTSQAVLLQKRKEKAEQGCVLSLPHLP